jgi:hypothetical protein
MENKDILTSVKVNPELFETFKIHCVKNKTSLNKLVNKAMDLYLNNDEFRKTVNSHSTSFSRK